MPFLKKTVGVKQDWGKTPFRFICIDLHIIRILQICSPCNSSAKQAQGSCTGGELTVVCVSKITDMALAWFMSHLWGWRWSLLIERETDCETSPSLYNCSRVNSFLRGFPDASVAERWAKAARGVIQTKPFDDPALTYLEGVCLPASALHSAAVKSSHRVAGSPPSVLIDGSKHIWEMN